MRGTLVKVLSDTMDEGGDGILGASICEVDKLKVVDAWLYIVQKCWPEQHVQDIWRGWQLVRLVLIHCLLFKWFPC